MCLVNKFNSDTVILLLQYNHPAQAAMALMSHTFNIHQNLSGKRGAKSLIRVSGMQQLWGPSTKQN